MENQGKGAFWWLILAFCLPWAAQATSIPPRNGAFHAPMHMVQSSVDSSIWLTVSQGEIPKVNVHRLAANGDTIFTNHYLPADEEQICLGLCIEATGDPLILVEQRTYFPPFDNRVELHRLNQNGGSIWSTLILSSEAFSLGARQVELIVFGEQVLVTWLNNTSDFVMGQWVEISDGSLIGDYFDIISVASYGYAKAVGDTMIVIAAANNVATLSSASSQRILREMHFSYHPMVISCLENGLKIKGINNGVLYEELLDWSGESEYLQLDLIGSEVLPRELQRNDDWFTYRAATDTVKAINDGQRVIIGYGNEGIHHHELVSGSQGSSCVWRNGEDNTIHGQQMNETDCLWNQGGDFVLPLIGFGGIVPFTTCNGGEFGWLAAHTPNFQLTVIRIDRNTSATPLPSPAIVKEMSLQAFPNPFNSSVTLEWQILGDVELSIFSILGQRVAYEKVSGSQQFLWQPVGLASGQYFVHIQHRSGKSAEIKLVYLK